jgi:hypothetical protein
LKLCEHLKCVCDQTVKFPVHFVSDLLGFCTNESSIDNAVIRNYKAHLSCVHDIHTKIVILLCLKFDGTLQKGMKETGSISFCFIFGASSVILEKAEMKEN